MNNILIDYFRCPEDSVKCRLAGSLADEVGFFRFGQDIVCFGRTTKGKVSPSLEGSLDDVSGHCASDDGVCLLPFDPGETANLLRTEQYVRTSEPGISRRLARAAVRNAYYFLRPAMTVSVRRHLQRRFLHGWDQIPFPQWPVDCTVDRIAERVLKLCIESGGGEPIPFVWFWPDDYKACAIVTHDVETEVGRDFCSKLMDITEARGFKSSFQVIPEKRYTVSNEYLNEIRDRGFEVNLHGLNHDGRLFSNHDEFLRRAELINQYASKWGALGFRSPVLYRNTDWFDKLEFDYDMSLPNVGHLDPQRGGCCTIMPYFIGDIVELPLTMTQDYSLFNILQDYSLDLWKTQIKTVADKNGLISFIIHPDYVIDKRPQETYKALLEYLNDFCEGEKVWKALPKEAATWWRQRSKMSVIRDGDSWRVQGEGSERAKIAYAGLENGDLVYKTDEQYVRPASLVRPSEDKVKEEKVVEKRKRIAMVAYTFYASDPRVRRHVANLVNAGYDVDVIALSDPRCEKENGQEHVQFFLPRSRHYDRQSKFRVVSEYVIFTFMTMLVLLRNHLFRQPYSLVHINNMPNFLLFATLPLRILGVKNILDLHDTMPEIYQERFGVPPTHWIIRLLFFEERLCIRLADFAIAVNLAQLERLRKTGLGKKSYVIVHNLPDPNLFPRTQIPDSPPNTNDKFRIVYHGMLSRRLGMDIAVRAVAELRDKIPNLTLNIIGDGEHRAGLIKLTEELGIGDIVQFSDGFVPTEQLNDMLIGSDLAVLPSRLNTATELMLPTKLLEYVQLGIPCVTVATPAIAQYFEEPMVHFVEAENPSAFAEKILSLYKSPEERLATAHSARKFFDDYNFEKERDLYLEAVERLAK